MDMTLMIFIAPMVTVAIIVVTYYILLKKNKSSDIIIINTDEAINILKSKEYNRQIPNQWLIETLSIVNPFTINDESLLKSFKAKAIKMLADYNNEHNYEELILTIRKRIHHRIPILKLNDLTICLSKLVKQITLDCFLKGILNVNANQDLVQELPELIIHLWKHRDDKTKKHRLKELLLQNSDLFSQSNNWQQLQRILFDYSNKISKIITNDFDEKISNPLNIIIPGWETMWRLVFYTLLELLRRPILVKQLREELNNHSESYRKCHLIEWILKETLRLYPPTKNIYRKHLKTDQNICISIQQIHRNTSVWGSNALEYDPYRFEKKLTSEQERSYLPFAISCPAKQNFAYIFAGAIVIEILKYCPNFNITNQCKLLPTIDKPLDMKRNSYKELSINM